MGTKIHLDGIDAKPNLDFTTATEPSNRRLRHILVA